MAKEENITTRFQVDISDLKKGISEANKQIKAANAEFKAAAAGMDNWSKSTDGVQAKLKQLDTLLQQNKAKLEAYQKKVVELEKADKSYSEQIDKVKSSMQSLVDQGISKSSEEYKKYQDALNTLEKNQASVRKEIDDARIAMTNQQGTVNGIEKDIRNYEKSLSDLQQEEANAAEEAKNAGNAYNTLKSKIEDQEEELEKLKSEYSNVVLEQGANSESAKKLANDIDNLSGELRDNKAKLDDADKAADELDKSFGELDKEARDTSGGFTIMKGALANLVADGIRKAIDGVKKLASATYDSWRAYDKGADTIIAATGATGETAEELKKVYDNVSKSVVADFGDIGNAVGEVNTRFGLTGNELENTSTKFLKFAKLNGVDVKTAIDNTQAAMAAFGLSAESTSDMIDVLNQAGQDTGVSVDKLASSLVSNAPALQEMGYNAAEAAMFVANLEKSGADTSSVMAGMKKALANASKEGKPMSDAMAEIESSIKDAKDSADAITTASELFGAKAGPAIATAVRDGKISFKELGIGLSDFGNSVETTFEQTQDAPDKFALAMQNLKLETAKIFDTFLQEHGPQIEELINNFTENILPKITEVLGKVLKTITDITSNESAISGIVTAIGALIAAMAVKKVIDFASGIQKVIMALKTSETVTKLATAAQWLWNAAMTANPIGAVIAAVAALIVILVKLVKHFNDEEKAIKDVEKAQEDLTAATKAAEDAENSYIDAVDRATDAQKQLCEIEKETGISGAELFKQVQNGTKNYADLTEQERKVYKAYLENEEAQKQLKQSTEEFIAAKKAETIASLENDLALAKESGSYDDVKKSIIDAYEKGSLSAEEARDLMGAAMSEMSRKAQKTFMEDIPADINEGLDPKQYETTGQKIGKWFGSIWDGIKDIFAPVGEFFSTAFGKAYESVKENWEPAKEWASGKWEEIKSSFSDVGNWFGEKFGSAWTKIKEKFSSWGSYWSGLWNQVKEKFTSLGTKISEAISGSIKSGINGVIKMIESTINKAIGLINGAIGLINNIPGVDIGKVKELSLPRLAKGGVLKKGQVGLLEGSGAEAVVPLEKNTQWINAVVKKVLVALKNALSLKDESENNGYDSKVDYSALMLQAKSIEEFMELSAKRQAKILGENIDLTKEGWQTNEEILTRWQKANDKIINSMADNFKSVGQEIQYSVDTDYSALMLQAKNIEEFAEYAQMRAAKILGENIDITKAGWKTNEEILNEWSANTAETTSALQTLFDKACTGIVETVKNVGESVKSSVETDYSALMLQAKTVEEFAELAQKRTAKIMDENIDLTKEGWRTNEQILDDWAASTAQTTSQVQTLFEKSCESVTKTVKKIGESILYAVDTDYSALMQEADSLEEFLEFAKQREAKILGENIDLVENGWKTNEELLNEWLAKTQEIGKETRNDVKETSTTLSKAVDTVKTAVVDTILQLKEMINGMPDYFENIGITMMLSMARGIKTGSDKVIEEARNVAKRIIATFEDFGISIGENEGAPSISSAQLGAMASGLFEQAGKLDSGAEWNNVTNSNVNNFTQNIYAPKQPSRIEIYRQTRNLLNFAGEAGGV